MRSENFRSGVVALSSLILVFAIYLAFKSFISLTDALLNELQTKDSLLTQEITSEVFARDGDKIGEFESLRRYFVPLEQIPNRVIQAFISAEDKTFYSHRGISVSAMVRAYSANIWHRRITQGASTITQQLVRFTFLSAERSYLRKVKEIFLALALEAKLSKKQILELYLNGVFLGSNSYGVEAAARAYFNKPISEVSLGEAAILAALPKAPSFLAPHRHYLRAKQRQVIVLQRMLENGYISNREFELWSAKDIAIAPTNHTPYSEYAPHFVAELEKQLVRNFDSIDLTKEGLQIESTLDLEVQRNAATVLKTALTQLQQDLPNEAHIQQLEGAFVSINADTGAILGMLGGQNFETSQYNRATAMRRELSSAFVPIYYGLALERGFNLMDPLTRDPLDASNIPERRAPSLYESALTLDALASLDLVASLGQSDVVDFARELGLHFTESVANIGAGKGKATPLRLAAAYAPLVNGGHTVTLWYIDRVATHEQRELYRHVRADERAVLHPASAFIARTLLEHILQFGVTKEAQAHFAMGAGALAVTDNRHDGWFVYAHQGILTVFWIGVERGKFKLGSSPQDVYRVLGKLGEMFADATSHIDRYIPEQRDADVSFTTYALPGGSTRLLPFLARRLRR